MAENHVAFSMECIKTENLFCFGGVLLLINSLSALLIIGDVDGRDFFVL